MISPARALYLCLLLRRGWLFVVVFAASLASAISRWRAGDAPVRGGTYFSLQRQRKVGKRKPLTPLTPVQASKHQRPKRTKTIHQRVDAEYQQVRARIGGVSPLSLLTFFAAAKKVSPAPDRGNARAPARNRGCQRNSKTTNENHNSVADNKPQPVT